jgi:hypothetical protein
MPGNGARKSGHPIVNSGVPGLRCFSSCSLPVASVYYGITAEGHPRKLVPHKRDLKTA